MMLKKSGCGYLFKANPITPHADPRRVILLYRHAQPTLSLTEKIEQPRKKSTAAMSALKGLAEGVEHVFLAVILNEVLMTSTDFMDEKEVFELLGKKKQPYGDYVKNVIFHNLF